MSSSLYSSWHKFWPDGLLIAGAVAVGFAAAGYLALAPRALNPVAVVFAPGTSAAQAMELSADAGARILRAGRSPNIVIAIPEGEDFSARATARGAWIVADAAGVAGCENTPQ